MIYLLIFVVTLLMIYLHKNGKSKHFMELANKFPGPAALPILGNALAISKYPGGILHYLFDASKKYGTATRHWIGSSFYVYLTDPRDVEIILRDTQNIRKSKTYDFTRPWLGEGLITSTGQHWHAHRKAITPAFHFNILEKFVEIFNEKGVTLIKLLKKRTNGEIFNIYPYITLYTLDAIMETSMGIKINAQEETESEYVQSLSKLQTVINTRIFNPILHSKLIFPLTKYGREHKKHLHIVNNSCLKVIKERRLEINDLDVDKLSETDDIGKKKRMAFLDLLLSGQKSGSGFTDRDILEEVNTFMFAGHDTTSTAISFSIYALATNQDIQKKVFDEIEEIYGTESHYISLQDLQKSQYLDMFVKESLRMYPPVPSYSRLLETDLKITNYTIPAGTSVSCFAYGIHRNPEFFSKPEVFDPERFSPENTKTRHSYAFAPFSAGPRNCIGQKYAMLEIKLTIIELLQNFKILPGPELEKSKLQSFLILTPIDGINVRLENRV